MKFKRGHFELLRGTLWENIGWVLRVADCASEGCHWKRHIQLPSPFEILKGIRRYQRGRQKWNGPLEQIVVSVQTSISTTCNINASDFVATGSTNDGFNNFRSSRANLCDNCIIMYNDYLEHTLKDGKDKSFKKSCN